MSFQIVSHLGLVSVSRDTNPSRMQTVLTITLPIIVFVDFVHHPEFKITRKHNVPETGSVSVFREGKETPALFGPLEKTNLERWTI
jgi:hypothetical protein